LTGAACGNEGKQACKISVATRASGGVRQAGAAIAARSAVAIEGNAINCDIAAVDK
jgi:hypothetical protein